MVARKTYGLRILKNGEPCTEFAYYSLTRIYEGTTQYEDEKALSDGIKEKFKNKYKKYYDKDAFYSAIIVFYPNKKETNEIVKKSEPGKFKSTGVEKEFLPILYKKDNKILNLNYIKTRFFKLLSSQMPNFRQRLKDFYSSSTIPYIDKNGEKKYKPSINIYRDVLGIIKAYESGTAEDLNYKIEKLYNKIIKNSPAERTKIFMIMEKEFPEIKPKKEKPIIKETTQKELDTRPTMEWLVYMLTTDEEREKYQHTGPRDGDFKLYSDILWAKKIQDEGVPDDRQLIAIEDYIQLTDDERKGFRPNIQPGYVGQIKTFLENKKEYQENTPKKR